MARKKKHTRKSKVSQKPLAPEASADSQAVPLSNESKSRRTSDSDLAEPGSGFPESRVNSLDQPSPEDGAEDSRPTNFFSGRLELPKDRTPWQVVILLILFAYALSVYVRLDWVEFANRDNMDSLRWEGVPMPNTHDSFYFGAVLQKGLEGMHANNDMVPSVLHDGMITTLPYLLVKFTPMSIEETLLWVPVWVAGLVCVPLVLIGRLYGSVFLGFFAACLAVVSTSYYNRTLAGYFDTDMYSVTVPVFALFFLLAACRKESLRYALAGALTLYLYRFFYASGYTITGPLCLAFIGYRFGLAALERLSIRFRGETTNWVTPSVVFSCKASLLVGFAFYAEEWSRGIRIEQFPLRFALGLVVLVGGFFLLRKAGSSSWNGVPKRTGENEGEDDIPLSQSRTGGGFSHRMRSREFLAVFTAVFLVFVMSFGNFGTIIAKVVSYMEATGSPEGVQAIENTNKTKTYNLHFHDVKRTIREAKDIDKRNVRNRILADVNGCNCPSCKRPAPKKYSGGRLEAFFDWYFETPFIPTCYLAFVGLGLLVLRYWEFAIGLPFVVPAVLCFTGNWGLRFTVHSVPIASLGMAFLVVVLCWGIYRLINTAKGAPRSWGMIGALVVSSVLVTLMVVPNVNHAKRYHADVVYSKKTVETLKVLKKNSSEDDFVVTWWDYGSGVWFYSGNRTFASPSRQTVDAYLLSQILRTPSEKQAAKLCRLMTEEFVTLKEKNKEAGTHYATAVRSLYKDATADLEYYPKFLADLEDDNATVPKSTRDVFVFLPAETLRIFPTIMTFSDRNLFVEAQSRNWEAPKYVESSSIALFLMVILLLSLLCCVLARYVGAVNSWVPLVGKGGGILAFFTLIGILLVFIDHELTAFEKKHMGKKPQAPMVFPHQNGRDLTLKRRLRDERELKDLSPREKQKALTDNVIDYFPVPVARKFTGASLHNGVIRFDDGSTLDKSGILRISHYGQPAFNFNWPISGYRVINPESAKTRLIPSIEFQGLKIGSAVRSSPYVLLILEERKEVILLDKSLYRSTFARKHLLDVFDSSIYDDSSFEELLSGKVGTFAGAHFSTPWSDRLSGDFSGFGGIGFHKASGNPTQGFIQVAGLGKLKIDYKNRLVTVPGESKPVPFSWSRESRVAPGQFKRMPIENPQAPYHVVDKAIPYFDPAKGDLVGFSRYFMTREFFDSFFSRAFLREDLDPELFEPVHRSLWGKIYRLKL